MIDTNMGATRIDSFSRTAMRAARTAKQWSPGRLAAELGVAVATVRSGERETSQRTPEPGTLVHLAAALDVAPDALLTTPRSDWNLTDLRVTRGHLQHASAALIHVPVDRFSHFESGFARLSDDEITALADLYEVPVAEVERCYQRTLAALKSRTP